MQTVKKGIVLVLVLVLCMNFVPVGVAEEIRIPATAAEALARLPIEVPPIPQITVDDSNPEECIVYIEGLEAWPLKDGSKLQSGAFIYSYYAEKGPYVPIQGREDEPLSIAIPRKDQGSALYFYLEEKGALSIWGFSTSAVQVSLEFEDARYRFVLDGTLEQYTFNAGRGKNIIAQYGADGLLYAYSYDYFNEKPSWTLRYDTSGRVISTTGLEKDGIEYRCENDQWHYWNGSGYTPCEKPEGIEIPAPAILEPKEGVIQIEAKREAYQASMPVFPTEDGMIPQSFDIESQFPAVPVLTREELEGGDLRYVLTGLEPWGIEMRYDYVYESPGRNRYLNATVPGQISWTIPAELISDWNEYLYLSLFSTVIPGSYSNILYDDWLDSWVFTICVTPDAAYEIVLGSSPYVRCCRYTLDDYDVTCYYTPQGTLEFIMTMLDGYEVTCNYMPEGTFYDIKALVDGVRLTGVYNADGQLMSLSYRINDLVYYFDSDANEWYDFSGDKEDICEPPEGFDLSPWMTLDVNRLEPKVQQRKTQ